MNNREEATTKILAFLKDDNKKVALVTGTHQFEKHKLVMRLIDEQFRRKKVLFRTNVLYNLPNYHFVGFAGIKSKPKSGELYPIWNNYYFFDSEESSTWWRAPSDIDFAILYPFGMFMYKKSIDAIENVLRSQVKKIFIISSMDYSEPSEISKYYDCHIIYDAIEEDEKQHNEILFSIEEYRKNCKKV